MEKESLRLEHDIAFVCEEMKANGFFFNFKEAQKLYQEISLKVETFRVISFSLLSLLRHLS